MEESSVYILLTRSGTWFSRLIHLATADVYTHASIGLDGPHGPFYSFARKYHRFALPAGLVEEYPQWNQADLSQARPHCLYELKVSQETFSQLRRKLASMYARREEYHYNLLGTLACYFNIPLRRRHYYFCSQFVATLLQDSGAVALSKPPSLVRPVDFCHFDELCSARQGRLSLSPLRQAI